MTTTWQKLAGGSAALVLSAGAVVTLLLAAPADASQTPYPGPFAGPGTHYGVLGDVTGWSQEQSTGILTTLDSQGNVIEREIIPATIYTPPGFDQGVLPACPDVAICSPSTP